MPRIRDRANAKPNDEIWAIFNCVNECCPSLPMVIIHNRDTDMYRAQCMCGRNATNEYEIWLHAWEEY